MQGSYHKGMIGGMEVDVMLDSASLVQQGVLSEPTDNEAKLVSASGDRLPTLDHVKAPVKLGELN